MAYRLHVEETTYTIQAPINAPSLGRRLGEAGLDVQRLALALFIRVVLLAVAAFVWWRSGDFEISSITGKAVIVICLIFFLYPLRHCKDSMQFYENGIVFNGRDYIFKTNKATWSKSSGTGYLLSGIRLHLVGMSDGANVSYIKDAQKLFTQFYLTPRASAGAWSE